MTICIGTRFTTRGDAEQACPAYCNVQYCKDCEAYHVVQPDPPNARLKRYIRNTLAANKPHIP
jgi:hypothetical protein